MYSGDEIAAADRDLNLSLLIVQIISEYLDR